MVLPEVVPRLRSALPLAVLLLPGCDGLLGPGEEKRIGVIVYYELPVEATLPDTVQVGVPFELSILTYGGGCLSEGPTRIRVRGLQVDVTPYDIHSGAEVCTDDLRFFPHKAALALPTPGLARFLFYGKQRPDGLPITVGRDVYVRK